MASVHAGGFADPLVVWEAQLNSQQGSWEQEEELRSTRSGGIRKQWEGTAHESYEGPNGCSWGPQTMKNSPARKARASSAVAVLVETLGCP